MVLSPVERLGGLPFFSEDDYRALNPDVAAAGIDALDHAFRHGIAEGRPLFRRERLAQAWGTAVLATAGAPPPAARPRPAPDGAPPRLSVAVSSWSDPADVALAAGLVEALRAAGFALDLLDETADPAVPRDGLVVVAPHAFFTEGLGPLWCRDGLVERCLVLNTAAPHRPEFRRALPFVLRSRGLLDPSPQNAHMLERSGLPVLHLRLASAPRRRWLAAEDASDPLVAALPAGGRGPDFDPLAWDTRPFDIGFFGRNTARRSRFLQRNAAALAQRPCFIYAAQPCRDALDESVAWRRHPRLAGHVGGQARLTLLIAEDTFPDFDWHRCIVGAMASGSVVIADTVHPHPDYRAGVQLFQADVRHLADLARWLLDDPDGRDAALAARAAAFAVLERSVAGLAGDLAAFLATLAPLPA